MPAMPEGPGVREGIVKGLYRCRPAPDGQGQAAGAAARQRRDPARGAEGAGDPRRAVRRRRRRVERDELRRALSRGPRVERWNMLHPGETPRVPYVTQCFEGTEGPIVAASDYLKVLPDLDRSVAAAAARVARHRRLRPQREPRRRCAITSRSTRGSSPSPRWRRSRARSRWSAKVVQKAIKDLEIDPEKSIRRSRRPVARTPVAVARSEHQGD